MKKLDDELKPVVYAGIINEIGRTQYSGSTAWLMEYIGNAVDTKANEVNMRLQWNAFEISDDGKGIKQFLKGNVKKVK